MADIFLSYAREDRPWASRLAAGLIEHGWSLFWDSHIPVGKIFDQVIENQLDAAGCIVVLWSRHSISSNWVKAEASEGARRGILHPVLIENVKLPLEFRRLQTANLTDWQRGTSHGEFDQLLGGIAATLRSQKGLYERLQEARAVLGRGDCARCLKILREIADAAEAAGLGDEVAELRRTAEAAQDEARREELRGQRARAEERRAAIGASRSQAQAAEAATRASALWLAAEAKMGEAAAAFDDEAYLQAAEYCEEATALYGQAGAAAREAAGREEVERQRHAAEEAHERMSRARESARSTDARERAPTLWIDAERRAAEGQAALAEDAPVRALKAFEEAAASYRQAEEAAREDMRCEEVQRQAQANQARDTAREGRNAAAILHAAQRAPNHWEGGERKFGAAEAALAGDDYSEAQRLFDEAARIYESAGRAAREVLHRARQGADASRERMAAEREAAQVAEAIPREGPLWSAAEAAVAAAEAAYEREQYDGSTEGFAKAADLFQAEHARERLARSRMAAVALDAPAVETLPPDLAETTVFDEVEGREPAPLPAFPTKRLKRRPTWRLGGVRLVACVGGIAVVLSALGMSWYRSAQEETPKVSTAPPSPAPLPPESSPSQLNPSRQAPGPSPATNREREVVEDLSKKAAAAREHATKASAERFANALFATAAGHQGDAEAALAVGRVADAQAAYRRVLDGFAVAATEAQNVLARKQDETGRLQQQVEVSRRTAAGAQAEKLAGPQWTKATGLYQAAQGAVARGDHDKAGELLKEATAGFGNAAKAAAAGSARLAKLKEDDVKGEPVRALSVAPSGERADAEAARLRMAAAKRAAEQVAAGFFANKRFTSAQSKERDGIAALGQSDYRAAIRLLVEAQSEYQAAVPEARREAERDHQLAPLKASLEQAHAAAAARREQALAAEADDLARAVFDQAQARQVEGDGLANRQELAAAAQAYRDAAERYGDATLRARAARAAK